MNHLIKNVDKVERTLPVYDGTDRFIKFGDTVEAEITTKVRYMINNGFFEDLGKVKEDICFGDESVNNALENIDEEQEDFFPEAEKEGQKKAITEECAPKPRKKRVKRKYKKIKTEDD